MKRLTTFLLLSLTSSLLALPVGNPWEASLLCSRATCFELPCLPSGVNFHLGFSGNYVIDKHLRVDRTNDNSMIHQSRFINNGGMLACNFCDRVELYTTLGAFKASLTSRFGVFRTGVEDNDNFIITTDPYFSSSIGARGTLWQCGPLGIGVEGEYFFSRPRLNSEFKVSSNTTYFNGRFKYREWQVAAGITYCVPIIACCLDVLPYGAIRFNGVKVDMGNAAVPANYLFTLYDLTNDKRFGYSLGLTMAGSRNWLLNFEGAFANELAINITGEFRF